MADIFKKPYEISLWKEVLIFETKCFDKNGNLIKTVIDEEKMRQEWPEGTAVTEVVQYYKERKIAIIGSDTMNTPVRAVNSKLISKVNGENTLTFSVYSKYWDEDAEEFFDNPFLKLLVNERKIKLRYGPIGDCKWYDLIIKNVQENSETKTFTYTAKDQFVNELSKSGFELVLDAELENNMGNIEYLAEKVLEGSDWELGEDNSLLRQCKEEPLYRIVLKESIQGTNMLTGEKIIIPASKTILGFYGPITNKEDFFQFLYREDGVYTTDDNYVINNSSVWYYEGAKYSKDGAPTFAANMSFAEEYRGERFVRQVKTKYDPILDRYVQVYENSGTTYYGYTESEYVSPTTVQNFITQPNGFTSYSGWDVGGVKSGEETLYPYLELQGYPDMRDIDLDKIGDTEYISFLKYRAENNKQVLYNSGIADFRSDIKGFIKDEQFVFRIKYATATENEDGRPSRISYIQSVMPRIRIGEVILTNGKYTIKDTYFDSQGVTVKNVDNYVEVILKCTKSIPYSQLIEKKLGLLLSFPANTNYYIEDVQFFRYVTYEKDGKTLVAVPGGELIASVKTKYYYYPEGDYKDVSEISYIYEGYEPWLSGNEVYNDDNFEKIRSITAKESNRFNLIQTLCETFECWPKFEIEHDMSTGEILLDENYRQKKWVTFHEYVGKDNYAGFKYGINLKSIQRTLDSNGAVSKLIVKDNANQFADNGFCSIARAQENYTGENFIYDFSYYIQQGLMGFSEVTNDLYLDVNGYIGYYKKLRELNRNREDWIEEQTGLLTDISEFESAYQTYKVSVESAEEELRATEIAIERFAGYTYTKLLEIYKKQQAGQALSKSEQEALIYWDSDEIVIKINKLTQLKNTIARHSKLRDAAKTNLDTAQSRFEELADLIENLASAKRALNLQFYKKYSRFIQEGSWIKEDYVDDNLYYLDAEGVLHTSTQPKVTYNINVLELSSLPGYENYKFELGDKTFIEDTEFFGWTWASGVKTPYHEEIVVSEITIALDSPEQNTIKVQNYKTQFEDLFQRIAATTQSVEYHTGEYTRATTVVETDGTIVADTLQNSITNNAIRLENAKDQSVVWDETGITTTSLSKPNEMLRLISGGLFLSVDGGITWSTGITGSGINASYITSGCLNTGMINIMNNGVPSFRWDSTGLNAFQFQIDVNTGKPYGFNIAKFVRFDQYGIYGINSQSEFDPNVPENGKIGEDKIWENANYALTWKGFMLKNDDGSVRITSAEDIQVMGGNTERIKIGRIKENVYGIRISNAEGTIVMETDDQGELWLRERLQVGTPETSKVEIGYLDATRNNTEIHEVIHAGDEEQEFIVYEDGKMVAQGAVFHGTIVAEGSKIGNMTVGEIEEGIENIENVAEAVKKLDIQSKLGYNFKVEEDFSTPSELELEAKATGFIFQNVEWLGSNNFESWTSLGQGEKIIFSYNDFVSKDPLNSTYYIKAKTKDENNKEYEAWTTIMAITAGGKGEKGEDGKDAIYCVIESDQGNIFKNNNIKAKLTCRIYNSNGELDLNGSIYNYIWSKNGEEMETIRQTGKIIEISDEDVQNKAKFSCFVSIKEVSSE